MTISAPLADRQSRSSIHYSRPAVRGSRSTLLLLALAVILPVAAHAQSLSDFERSRYSPAAYYNYAEPGDVTIMVNVWGTVRNPGLYEIPRETKLSTLLSVAGGPIVSQREHRTDRTIEIRLFRDSGNTRSVVFENTMANEVFASEENPVLQEGDVLTVETVVTRRFSWRDVFPIVAAVASVALAVERISR